MNTSEFGGTFWLTVTGVISAFISGALVYAIKSKCSRCSLCFGLIDIGGFQNQKNQCFFGKRSVIFWE
jgi:hypothetical protein